MIFTNRVGARIDRTNSKVPTDENVLYFGPNQTDPFRREEAYRGVQIFGATGSGKSSGSGKTIQTGYLGAGFGGLVLCVKTEEGESWSEAASKLNRQEDMRSFCPSGDFRFNFLDWFISTQPIFSPVSAAELLLEISSISSRSNLSQQKDPFWDNALARLLTNAIALAYLATNHVTIDTIHRIVATANSADGGVPLSFSPGSDGDDYLEELAALAKQKHGNSRDLELALDFLRVEFRGLAEKTRSIIYTMFTALTDLLLREPLRTLFQTTTNLTPIDALEGRIIVVDIPIHLFDRVGRMANAIWKTCFKYAAQRRSIWKDSASDVFLWADESQYIIDPSDAKFLTTARSSRCATVHLTQNIQNYLSELTHRPTVLALLESLHTRIYHQNGDEETNRIASERIGRLPTTNVSKSISGGRTSTTESEQWQVDVPQRYFTNLRSGGPLNKFTIDGVVHIPGRKFSTGKTWIAAEFHQKIGH